MIPSLVTYRRASPAAWIDPRKGFEICRSLVSIEDYEKTLLERHRVEADLRWAGVSKESKDTYWEHRYATLQIEWCYEIMKVA